MKTLKERQSQHDNRFTAKEDKKHLSEAMTRIRFLEKELGAKQSVSVPIKTHIIKPARNLSGSEAVAIAVASDWHVGEVVNPRTVSGLNAYNPDIARERADTFFGRIVKLTAKEEQDVTIKTIVLALLGDFVTGNIHDENVETNAFRPIEETLYAQELLASGIEYLLANTDKKLIIPCCVGNHSRITRKIHMATEVGNSLETFMYHALRTRFANEKRVTFLIADGYHLYLDVFGSTMRFHHGHSVQYNGGIGTLTIPLMKSINTWNVTKPVSFDVLGHFHSTHIHRRFAVNGSMIGYNAYALRTKCEFEPPSQLFFLWDSKRGRTVLMPILFDK